MKRSRHLIFSSFSLLWIVYFWIGNDQNQRNDSCFRRTKNGRIVNNGYALIVRCSCRCFSFVVITWCQYTSWKWAELVQSTSHQFNHYFLREKTKQKNERYSRSATVTKYIELVFVFILFTFGSTLLLQFIFGEREIFIINVIVSTKIIQFTSSQRKLKWTKTRQTEKKWVQIWTLNILTIVY